MLPRPLTARRAVAPSCVGALGLALANCSGGAGDDRAVGTSMEAIIGGSLVDASNSPVLYLSSPEGACSAVLVAPTLALTTRHCVATTTSGSFSCTPSGDVVDTGSGAGQIGADNAPDTLRFFSTATIAAYGTAGTPDAVGTKVISTDSPTSCRDDLAFVVLDRTIPGLAPVPLRVCQPTSVGEMVTVAGYGLTDHVEVTALRVVTTSIVGVGPDMPASTTQPAPLRALQMGPVTCLGDSGGPVISTGTGAVVAIVSLGSQVGSSGPYCSSNSLVDTIGPRLAAYHDWIASVFQVVGASPTWNCAPADAAADSTAQAEAAAPPEAGPPRSDGPTLATDSGPDSTPEVAEATVEDSATVAESSVDPPAGDGGGCACSAAGTSHRASKGLGVVTVALAWTAAAVGRRRR